MVITGNQPWHELMRTLVHAPLNTRDEFELDNVTVSFPILKVFYCGTPRFDPRPMYVDFLRLMAKHTPRTDTKFFDREMFHSYTDDDFSPFMKVLIQLARPGTRSEWIPLEFNGAVTLAFRRSVDTIDVYVPVTNIAVFPDLQDLVFLSSLILELMVAGLTWGGITNAIIGNVIVNMGTVRHSYTQAVLVDYVTSDPAYHMWSNAGTFDAENDGRILFSGEHRQPSDLLALIVREAANDHSR